MGFSSTVISSMLLSKSFSTKTLLLGIDPGFVKIGIASSGVLNTKDCDKTSSEKISSPGSNSKSSVIISTENFNLVEYHNNLKNEKKVNWKAYPKLLEIDCMNLAMTFGNYILEKYFKPAQENGIEKVIVIMESQGSRKCYDCQKKTASFIMLILSLYGKQYFSKGFKFKKITVKKYKSILGIPTHSYNRKENKNTSTEFFYKLRDDQLKNSLDQNVISWARNILDSDKITVDEIESFLLILSEINQNFGIK